MSNVLILSSSPIYFMEMLKKKKTNKKYVTCVLPQNLWSNPKQGAAFPPFSLQIYSLSCSVPRKLTWVPCLLDSAWVWLMRSSSSQSDDGREERWGSPGPLVPSLPQLLPGPSFLQLQLSQDSVTTFSSCHLEFIDPLQLLAFLIYLDSAHTLQIVHSLNEPNYQSEVCHLFPARPLSDTSNTAEYYFIRK